MNEQDLHQSRASASKWFITYGDDEYKATRRRILYQALSMDFDNIIGYGFKDLDAEYVKKNEKFFKDNKKGGGYWMWKPQIVWQTLQKMKEGDLLVYADAGCQLNKNGKQRLEEYYDMVTKDEKAVLSFELPFTEYEYTKMDTILAIDPKKEYCQALQLVGGIFVLRKCERTMKLVQEWLKLVQDYHLIDDSPSKAQNHETFKDHRHDQSIWSLLRKKYGTISLSDETWTFYYGKGDTHPIWAIRTRNGL